MLRLHQSIETVFLVLLFASVLSVHSPLIPSLPSVDGATRNIILNGAFAGWNSTFPGPPITVTRGDAVNLTLSSRDSTHQFYVDISGDADWQCPQEKCSPDFPPNNLLFSFVVDFEPGRYRYYCHYHQPTMMGDFIVQGFTVTSSPSSLRIVQGFSNVSTIAVTSTSNFAGVVDLSTAVLPAGPNSPLAVLNPTSLTLSPDGTEFSTLTVSTSGSTPIGNYNVNVTGTSGSAWGSRVIPVLVVPPDFDISANPTRLVIPLGSTKNSTITLRSFDTFSGDVALSSDAPAGMTTTFTPTIVTLTSGGRVNSTMDVSISPTFAPPGTYKVNVTGTSGSLTHNTTVTVVAGPDFDPSISPTTLFLTPGSSDTSTITLTSLNNFTGTVTLSGTVQPDGPIFTIAPSDIFVPDGGTVTAVLRVNASTTTVAGNYTVTVHATSPTTSGFLNNSSPVSVLVRDFALAASIVDLTVRQDNPATVTLSVRSLNGFAGVVSLTASSSALSLLLNVTTITFDASGIEFVALNINAATVQAGTFVISIIGTSESLVRTVSLSITVQPSPDGSILLPVIGGMAAGAIVIAAAGVYFVRRRGRKESRASDPA